jgi:hypothetical protein
MIIDPTPELIAKIILAGFNKHYSLFRECSSGAKQRFEEMRWIDGQQAIKDRIQFYDDRVSETTTQLCDEFNAEGLAENIWQQTKLNYIGFYLNIGNLSWLRLFLTRYVVGSYIELIFITIIFSCVRLWRQNISNQIHQLIDAITPLRLI